MTVGVPGEIGHRVSGDQPGVRCDWITAIEMENLQTLYSGNSQQVAGWRRQQPIWKVYVSCWHVFGCAFCGQVAETVCGVDRKLGGRLDVREQSDSQIARRVNRTAVGAIVRVRVRWQEAGR